VNCVAAAVALEDIIWNISFFRYIPGYCTSNHTRHPVRPIEKLLDRRTHAAHLASGMDGLVVSSQLGLQLLKNGSELVLRGYRLRPLDDEALLVRG
jgi:hypothetical protein